eukprot:999607-Rhodomonas_salina.1
MHEDGSSSSSDLTVKSAIGCPTKLALTGELRARHGGETREAGGEMREEREERSDTGVPEESMESSSQRRAEVGGAGLVGAWRRFRGRVSSIPSVIQARTAVLKSYAAPRR